MKKSRAIEQDRELRVPGFLDQFANYSVKITVGEMVPAPLLGDGL